MLLVITYGVVYYYDHFYYMFSHFCMHTQVNDFNKRVDSKVLLKRNGIAVIVRNEFIIVE